MKKERDFLLHLKSKDASQQSELLQHLLITSQLLNEKKLSQQQLEELAQMKKERDFLLHLKSKDVSQRPNVDKGFTTTGRTEKRAVITSEEKGGAFTTTGRTEKRAVITSEEKGGAFTTTDLFCSPNWNAGIEKRLHSSRLANR